MPDTQIAGEQLTIKSRVLLLCGVELIGEKSQWPRATACLLMKRCPNVCPASIHLQQQLHLLHRVNQLRCVEHGTFALLISSPHNRCP